jgi:hypothetical protein
MSGAPKGSEDESRGGKAEVENADAAIGTKDGVGELEVAVDDTDAVCRR